MAVVADGSGIVNVLTPACEAFVTVTAVFPELAVAATTKFPLLAVAGKEIKSPATPLDPAWTFPAKEPPELAGVNKL